MVPFGFRLIRKFRPSGRIAHTAGADNIRAKQGSDLSFVERRNPLARCLATVVALLLVFPPAFLAGTAASAQKATVKPAQAQAPWKGRLPISDLSEDEAILHALNRLGFGPRPGDIARVRETGLEKWIDRQLNPDSIDDSALNARLNIYPTLAMSSAQLSDLKPVFPTFENDPRKFLGFLKV